MPRKEDAVCDLVDNVEIERPIRLDFRDTWQTGNTRPNSWNDAENVSYDPKFETINCELNLQVPVAAAASVPSSSTEMNAF